MSRVSDARQGDYYEAIERLFHDGTTSGLSEVQLLERFAARRDGAAFAALVERHGPMVLGVCRRFLRDPNDVDDAFQAVFLVLVRRAGDIRRKELLGNWLYGVACRVAVRARSLAARRPSTTLSEADGDRIAADLRRPSSREPDEGGSWLHEEVERLPRRYRAPVVACYFEGRTHEEAAALLGCPLGTVKGRLSRARDLLRKRLERRGVVVPAVALAAQLSAPDLRAAIPASLAQTTVRSGLTLASAASTVMTTSAISLTVRTLTQGVLHAMVVTQIKAAAIPTLLVAAGVLTAGARVAARQDADGKTETKAVAVPSRPQSAVDETAKPGSIRDSETESPLPERLRTFHRLDDYWRHGFYELRNRLGNDLAVLKTKEDKKLALTIYNDQVESVIRDIDVGKAVPEAGRELRSAFAKLLRTLARANLSDEANIGALRPNQQDYQAFQRFQDVASMYASYGETLREDLRRLKSPESRQAARALHRSHLAAMDPYLNLDKYEEPFRDFAMAFSTYLQKVERNPEPPEVVATSEAPKAKPEKPAEPAKPRTAQASNTQSAQASNKNAAKGGASDGGGMDGPTDGERRQDIERVSAYLRGFDQSPQTQAVLKALDEPITLRFAQETPLEKVLDQIKEKAKGAGGEPIPIYVDPNGLQEAEVTLQSVVSIDLANVPLKFSLRLILKQIRLAYCVRDGVVIISSLEGVEQELMEAESEQIGLRPELFPQGYTGINIRGKKDDRGIRKVGAGTKSANAGFQ